MNALTAEAMLATTAISAIPALEERLADAPAPDMELISLADRFVANETRIRTTDTDPNGNLRDDEFATLIQAQVALVDELGLHRATTALGIAARVRCLAVHNPDEEFSMEDDWTVTGKLVRQVIADGVASLRAAAIQRGPDGVWRKSIFPTGQHPCDAVPMPREPEPDETLLELGEQLDIGVAAQEAAWSVYETTRDQADHDTALVIVKATSAIVAQIVIITATTLGGLQVKRRALDWCRARDALTAKELADPYLEPPQDMVIAAGILADLADLADLAGMDEGARA